MHMMALQIERWQAINTAIYWHVLPSLQITGPLFLRDTRKLDSLKSGMLANGGRLVEWALSFATVDSLDDQQSLITSIHKFKIPSTATCVQLETAMHRLLETWKLVDGNAVAQPYGYYQRLLAGMPADEGKHLTTVRSWLASELNGLKLGKSHWLIEVDSALDAIVAYAKQVGLPPGESVGGAHDATLLFLDQCGAADEDGEEADGGQLNALGERGGRPPKGGKQAQKPGAKASQGLTRKTAADNNCTFCDAFCCRSTDLGGPQFCKSRFDSEADLSKESNGNARHCRAARAYHKVNPQATTLKGKRFVIGSKGAKPAGAAAGAREGVTAIITVDALFGRGDGVKQDEFLTWLKEHDEDEMVQALGDLADLSTESAVTITAVDVSATGAPLPSVPEADEAAAAEGVLALSDGASEQEQVQATTEVPASAQCAVCHPPLDAGSAPSRAGQQCCAVPAPVAAAPPLFSPVPFPLLSPAPALVPADSALVPVSEQLAALERARASVPVLPPGGGYFSLGAAAHAGVPGTPAALVPAAEQLRAAELAAAELAAHSAASVPRRTKDFDRGKTTAVERAAAEVVLTARASRTRRERAVGWLHATLDAVMAIMSRINVHLSLGQWLALLASIKFAAPVLRPMLSEALVQLLARAGGQLLALLSAASSAARQLAARLLLQLAGLAARSPPVNTGGAGTGAPGGGSLGMPDYRMVSSSLTGAVVQAAHRVLGAVGTVNSPVLELGGPQFFTARNCDDAFVQVEISDEDRLLVDESEPLPLQHPLTRSATDSATAWAELGASNLLTAHVPAMSVPSARQRVVAHDTHSAESWTQEGLDELESGLGKKALRPVGQPLNYVRHARFEQERFGKSMGAPEAPMDALNTDLEQANDSLGESMGAPEAPMDALNNLVNLEHDGGSTFVWTTGALEAPAVQEPFTTTMGAPEAPMDPVMNGLLGAEHADGDVLLALSTKKRAGPPADAADTLLLLKSDAHEALASAVREATDTDGHCITPDTARTVGFAIGRARVNAAMISAIGAVVARIAHPTVYVTDENAISVFGCSRRTYYNAKLEIGSIVGKDDGTPASKLARESLTSGAGSSAPAPTEHDPVLQEALSLMGHAPVPILQPYGIGAGLDALLQATDAVTEASDTAGTRVSAAVQLTGTVEAPVRLVLTLNSAGAEVLAAVCNAPWHASCVCFNGETLDVPTSSSEAYNSSMRDEWLAADRSALAQLDDLDSLLAQVDSDAALGMLKSFEGMLCDDATDDLPAALGDDERRLQATDLGITASVADAGTVWWKQIVRDVPQLSANELAVAHEAASDWQRPEGYDSDELVHAHYATEEMDLEMLPGELDLALELLSRAPGGLHAELSHGSLPCLDDEMMMALPESSNTQLLSDAAAFAVPPAALTASCGGDGVSQAALSDNGASLRASCTKSLAGMVPGTRKEGIALGVGNATDLQSAGSHYHMYKRYGVDGVGELVVRRMNHTPDLRMQIVFSEAAEVFNHQYEVHMARDTGRVYTAPDGRTIKLFMTGNKLAWFRVVPVTDPREMQDVIQRIMAAKSPSMSCIIQLTDETKPSLDAGGDNSLAVIGDGKPKAYGMPATELTGVALLRRLHIAWGHPALKRLLQTIMVSPGYRGRFTSDDVKKFASEGCGVCETAKMRRRCFTIKTVQDKSTPALGKTWVLDELSLRVLSAQYMYCAIFLAVEMVSKKKFEAGLTGMTTADITAAIDQLRTFVRPDHGEILVVRMDSLPGHTAKEMKTYLSNVARRDIGPPQVHETVGDPEGQFGIHVPNANAMLLGTSDLGESHFHAAFRTSIAASDYLVNDKHGVDPARSNNMVYYGKTEWMPSPLLGFGSGAKSLVHPEIRDSKYDKHARAAVYTGPAMLSHSPIHCSVWDGTRYIDVDVGCVSVDEAEVMARSARDHPSHQPFNQADPRQAELAAKATLEEDAPYHAPPVWHASSPPPVGPFTIGLCGGESRAGDVCSWHAHQTDRRVQHIVIDVVNGGHEHNIERPIVQLAILKLMGLPNCHGVFVQSECGRWSAARFRKMPQAPGYGPPPVPLFTLSARAGVNPQDPDTRKANALVTFLCRLLRAAKEAHGTTGSFGILIEHPASQAEGMPYESKDCKEHATMYDHPEMREVLEDLGMEFVYTDQCESGASQRKATALACSTSIIAAARTELGMRRCTHGGHAKGEDQPIGRDAAGGYRTRDMQVYTPLFAERLSRTLLSAWLSATGGDTASQTEKDLPDPLIQGAASGQGGSTAVRSPAEMLTPTEQPYAIGNDDLELHPFQKGAIVQVYWSGEGKWFQGCVDKADYATARIPGGSRVKAPQIQVTYEDDGITKTHFIHNNNIKLISGPTEPELNLLLAGRILVPHDRIAEHLGVQAEFDTLQAKLDDATFTVIDYQIDMETLELVNTMTMYAVVDNELQPARTLETRKDELYATGTDTVRDVNVRQAQHWHTPQNERDYERSPQKALWRTAKELKWSQYIELKMFTWRSLSEIDTVAYKIFNTLWAYKIKLHADLTFNKLNPRWCLKGGTMDRSVYKAFAETMRMSSFRTILALKGGYFDKLCDFMCDCSNAFQATRTDIPGDRPHPKMYCWPAPGFEKYDDKGRRMACELHVGMQGRIDATRLFSDRLFAILIKAGLVRCLWDNQLCIYHVGPLADTDASLTAVIDSFKGIDDSAPQQPPKGWAVMGWHVDDSVAAAVDVAGCLVAADNRVVKYIIGQISVVYATTLTGWHGNKALGFLLTLHPDTKQVKMSAPDALEQVTRQLLVGQTNVQPKHVMTADFYDIAPGVVPDERDPDRARVLAEMAMARHALGVFIWLYNAYPQLQAGTCALCSNMAFPAPDTIKGLRYQAMHMTKYAESAAWGGWPCAGLETPEDAKDLIPPFTKGKKAMYYEYFSDAALGSRSVQGGVGMLAAGVVQAISQRQQLASPCAHSAEVVAAGNNAHMVVPQNGLLQELRLRLGRPTPFYLDSKTTVFVSTSDTAVKKSVWLIRRAAVLQECVHFREIMPIHISEADMLADPMTKYLVFAVWTRHMWYLLNKLGESPPGKKG